MSAPLIPISGKCRVCGCTDAEACDLGDGDACWWVDAAHTLCSNPKCIAFVPLESMTAEMFGPQSPQPCPTSARRRGRL